MACTAKDLCYCTLSFILFADLSSCKPKQEKTNPVISDITSSVYAAGIIKTKNQYKVFPTITGIIDTVYVTENDLVRPGSPLMTISSGSSKIERQNADIAAKYADLKANKERLTDLENNISLAQSKYSSDSMVFSRQQQLWNQNIGTKLDLELKELASKNSITALESAKIKYKDLVKELEFNAQQSKNLLAISKKKESDFTIKSQVIGRVYYLPKEPGEIVNPQTEVALIGDAKHFLLQLEIDEYDIVRVKLSQSVLVTMDSYKGQLFEASVSKINPMMNEHTKTFTIEAEFTKAPPVLYPNLTAEANIVIAAKKNALLIPRVYLLDDSTVLTADNKKRAIVVGLRDYQKVEILSGLTSGDIIIKPQQ